jgi:hypothetical protein
MNVKEGQLGGSAGGEERLMGMNMVEIHCMYV